MWLFYTLLAAIFWGVGQIFVKKGFQDTSALFNTALATFFGVLIFVPFSLIYGVHFDQFFQLAPMATLIAILFLVYYYAISHGQISLTGTIIGTAPVITVILSLAFLHETLSLYQQLAIVIIILGTILVASPGKVGRITLGAWLAWGLFAVGAIGTADFLVKVVLNEYTIGTYLFTFTICSSFVTILLCFLDKKGRKLPKFSWKDYRPTLIGVGLIQIGFFAFQLAIADGLVSIVSPLSSIYIAITAILAWIFLKEKIDKLHFVGIALAALGVILIGIS